MKLKTLRELVEIHKPISGLFGDRVKINSTGNALTKGELKAIELSRESMVRCLKQEAIEHIKKLDELVGTNPPFGSEELEEINLVAHHNFESGDLEGFDAVGWIKRFFNISQEDLK